MRKIIQSKDGHSFWDVTAFYGMMVAKSNDKLWSVVVRYKDGFIANLGTYPTEGEAVSAVNDIRDFLFSFDDIYVMP